MAYMLSRVKTGRNESICSEMALEHLNDNEEVLSADNPAAVCRAAWRVVRERGLNGRQ